MPRNRKVNHTAAQSDAASCTGMLERTHKFERTESIRRRPEGAQTSPTSGKWAQAAQICFRMILLTGEQIVQVGKGVHWRVPFRTLTWGMVATILQSNQPGMAEDIIFLAIALLWT
jgi:hypothetical protein